MFIVNGYNWINIHDVQDNNEHYDTASRVTLTWNHNYDLYKYFADLLVTIKEVNFENFD